MDKIACCNIFLRYSCRVNGNGMHNVELNFFYYTFRVSSGLFKDTKLNTTIPNVLCKHKLCFPLMHWIARPFRLGKMIRRKERDWKEELSCLERMASTKYGHSQMAVFFMRYYFTVRYHSTCMKLKERSPKIVIVDKEDMNESWKIFSTWTSSSSLFAFKTFAHFGAKNANRTGRRKGF